MSLKTRASSNNQRARELGLMYNLHKDDIQFMLDFYNGCCAYCGVELTNENFQIDHVIPVTESNDNIINYGSVAYNIVPSCINCNQSKGIQDAENWVIVTFENPDDIIFKLNEYKLACGIDEIIW